jgi:hypothetical protein
MNRSVATQDFPDGGRVTIRGDGEKRSVSFRLTRRGFSGPRAQRQRDLFRPERIYLNLNRTLLIAK